MFRRTSANDCFCISEIQTTNNAIYTQAENFSFRIYKVFSYLFSFANFSSTKFIFAFQSFSLKMYIVSAKTYYFLCLYVLLSYMLCFYVCTHVCFHLISNVHIVRIFENRIPFQTFEKCLACAIKNTSDACSLLAK